MDMTVRTWLISLLSGVLSIANGQTYVSDKTSVEFYSHAAIEDIKADNQKGSALFDVGSGEIAFVIPIREFHFEKSLMQEHFNEKYMESDRFPKSTFQGSVEKFDAAGGAEQSVVAKGKLTIHGVTQAVEIPGKILKQGNILVMNAKFVVRLEDYKIQIPTLVWQNIAEQVEVTLNFSFKPK